MKQYLDLLRKIKTDGTVKPPARSNMPSTKSLFGYQFRHNLQDGFPLLTTKKMFWKGIVIELLWFLRGDTNIKFLDENGVRKMWHQDAYNYYQKQCAITGQYPLAFDDFCEVIRRESDINSLQELSAKHFNNGYVIGNCGHQYGKVWRDWHIVDLDIDAKKNNDSYHIRVDQIANVLKSLKENPEGRRHIVTAIDPAHENDLALYWCHAMFQFNCRPLTDFQRKTLLSERKGWEGQFANIDEDPSGDIMDICDELGIPKYYLDCHLYQRSADVVLGVPFNIASYALLTHLFARILGYVAGDFIHTFGDVHIYENHMAAVEEQLSREVRPLPKLHVLPNHIDYDTLPDHLEKYLVGRYDLDLFLKKLIYQDFRLEGYDPHPAIEAELSTGLIK
jgi:thymidylate synthase